jgi:hypothetical protein
MRRVIGGFRLPEVAPGPMVSRNGVLWLGDSFDGDVARIAVRARR